MSRGGERSRTRNEVKVSKETGVDATLWFLPSFVLKIRTGPLPRISSPTHLVSFTSPRKTLLSARFE